MRKGTVVILSDTRLLKEEIRGKRATVIETDKMNNITAKVTEGKLKGLVVYLPPNFFEPEPKEMVVFT
jgi:hypothetical protein